MEDDGACVGGGGAAATAAGYLGVVVSVMSVATAWRTWASRRLAVSAALMLLLSNDVVVVAVDDEGGDFRCCRLRLAAAAAAAAVLMVNRYCKTNDSKIELSCKPPFRCEFPSFVRYFSTNEDHRKKTNVISDFFSLLEVLSFRSFRTSPVTKMSRHPPFWTLK
jgi:hypothetical protein